MEEVQLLCQRSSGQVAQAEGGKTIDKRGNEASMVRLLRQISFRKDEERITGLEVQNAAPP